MIINVPLDLIGANPWQTRAVVDNEAVQELAADIAAHGLLQTPVGRLVKDGMRLDLVQTTEITVQFDLAKALEQAEVKVQLAFGHRRLEAFWNNLRENRSSSEILDWTSMPVEILVLGDQEMAAYAWSENEQRQEHTPLDRALAIQKRMDDFRWTQAEAADYMGISRPAVSNSLRLLKLPEEITQALGKGEMSERQAMALAGLYELPEDMLTSAEERFYKGHELRPSEIVKAALRGESSDKIRELVNRLAQSYGKSLTGLEWTLDDEMLGQDLRSPTCRACEFRIKERNICLDALCFQTKKNYFVGQYLANASLKSGIQPLEAGAETYVTDFEWSSEYATIRQGGCENLKLRYVPSNGRKRSNSLEEMGFPNAVVVCQKRAGQCSCLKGIDYARQQERAKPSPHPALSQGERVEDEGEVETISPRAEDAATQDMSALGLQELARQARAEKREIGKSVALIRKSLTQLLVRGLVEDDTGAWRLLAAKTTYSNELRTESTRDWDLDRIREVFCEFVATRMLPYDPKTAAEIINRVNDELQQVGMPGIVLLDDGSVGFGEKEVEGMPAF